MGNYTSREDLRRLLKPLLENWKDADLDAMITYGEGLLDQILENAGIEAPVSTPPQALKNASHFLCAYFTLLTLRASAQAQEVEEAFFMLFERNLNSYLVSEGKVYDVSGVVSSLRGREGKKGGV